MRREIEAIRKLLIAGKREVKAGKLWTVIADLVDVGDRDGKTIRFSLRDLERLRIFVKREAGHEPTLGTLKHDRVAQSGVANNEKLALGGVFDSMVLMSRPKGGDLPVEGIKNLPPGTVACVAPAELRDPLTISEPIVIVENGAIMAHVKEIQWPTTLENPIVMYRGHGRNLPQLMDWVLRIPDKSLVLGYFDLDPDGLLMTRQYGCSGCLIPKEWRNLTERSPANNPTKFFKQVSNRDKLSDDQRLPPRFRDHLIRNHIAVMQEHMVSHEMVMDILHFS
jgi:hypothetical protein